MSHATPAALYAHVSNRYWEDDSKVPTQYRSKCKDISRQLLESSPGRNINVILGGGRRTFLPINSNRHEKHTKNTGRRLDGRNLIHEWIREKNINLKPAQYITTKAELFNLNDDTEYLLGLFASSHLSFHCERYLNEETKEQPTLAEMTSTAIKVLSRNSNGFILVVESGRIDHAHHHNNAYRALSETLAIEEAVRSALDSTDLGWLVEC